MALGNINDIATFVSVVKAGSFTVAARQLGVTRSAVGKSIARLEDRLNVRLLNRTPRSLSLTDDGQLYFIRCSELLGELEEIEVAMAARSEKPTGILRLSLPPAIGHKYLTPLIDVFLKTWPTVDAEVSFTDRYVDLIDEGIDVAMRIGDRQPDSRLIARQVAQQCLPTSASPAYLAAHGTPATVAELADHPCLFFMSAGRAQAWQFNDSATPHHAGKRRLQMDSAEALLAAAVNGVGVIHLPDYLVNDEIRAGRLVRVLDAFDPPPDPIRLVYPTRRHLSPKVRLFIDFVIEQWGQTPPWIR
ncbi:Transcriptional regulator, LysR family [Pararobbsia alpina]|uniref:LysR family transcriptional regulator n=1 Tax=Pararobbsia alpina TaxID=621374 RepID=UPI0039A50258